MMFGHELIESLHFIAPHRPCVQMDENLLFIGCGLAKGGDFFLFHVRQHKKLRPACPAKSFNAFPFSGFPLPKNAPYLSAGRVSRTVAAGKEADFGVKNTSVSFSRRLRVWRRFLNSPWLSARL